MTNDFRLFTDALENEYSLALEKSRKDGLRPVERVHINENVHYLQQKRRLLCTSLLSKLSKSEQKQILSEYNTVALHIGFFSEPNDRFAAILKRISDAVTNDEAYAEVVAEVSAFTLPKDVYTLVDKPLSDTVTETVGKLAEEDPSDERIALLETADELVISDIKTLAKARADYAARVGEAIDSLRRERMLQALNDDGYGDWQAHFDGLTPIMSEDIVAELTDKMFTVADGHKDKFRTLLTRMDEMDLLSDESVEPIQKDGTYAFRKYIDARNEVINAVEGNNFAELGALCNRLNTRIEQMSELIELTVRLFGKELDLFPIGFDSCRNESIPAEFKRNAKATSVINTAYIALDFIRAAGLTADEYLDDPLGCAYKYIRTYGYEHGFDAMTEGKTLGRVLAEMSNAEPELSTLTEIERAAIPLRAITATDPDNKSAVRNGLLTLVFEAYAKEIHEDVAAFGEYFEDYIAGAAKNLFIVRDGERDYRSQLSEGFTDRYTQLKVPPFSINDYIISHGVDFAELERRITTELIGYLEYGGNAHYFPALVRGARDAAMRALLVYAPDDKSPEIKKLTAFIDNPEKALASSTKSKIEIPRVDLSGEKRFSSYRGGLEKEEQKKIDSFMKGEESYNKRADSIIKRKEALTAKLTKEQSEEKAAKINVQIQSCNTELEALKKDEIEKLKGALAAGKITEIYYKHRIADVESLNHNREASMFREGLADKKTYIKEQVSRGMSEKEAVAKYNAELAEEERILRRTVGRASLNITEKQ